MGVQVSPLVLFTSLQSEPIMKRLLICLLLVAVVGCGESLQAQPKSKETKKAKTSPPKEAGNPWDTPTRLALFMTQQIEDPRSKASALSYMAMTLATRTSTSATPGRRASSRWMKQSFTPAEKQLARHLVELVQEK